MSKFASCSAIAVTLPAISGCTLPVRSKRLRAMPRVAVSIREFPELDRDDGRLRLILDSDDSLFVCRAKDGSYYALSATCAHLGCAVRSVSGRFRCPCHGSSFDADGRVTSGPASAPLTRLRAWREADRVVIDLQSAEEKV